MSGANNERKLSAFDELGVLVGTEYEDCSIAASHARKAANHVFEMGEIKDEKKLRANFYPISPDRHPNDSEPLHAADLDKTFLYDDEEIKLIMVRSVEAKVERSKKGILRKLVEVKSIEYGDPVLAAQVGKDAYLPLATFKLREDAENCAYVQIGPEMRDDSVVMNSLDENTPRHSVVEAIRALLAERRYGNDSTIQNKETKRIILTLFEKLIEAQAEQLLQAEETMLVRRCFETLYDEKTQGKKISLLNENAGPYTQTMRFAKLLTGSRLQDGRVVDLALVKPFDNNDKDNYLQLVALARGNIALPLAKMFKETGTVVFEEDNTNTGIHRQLSISILLDRLKKKPFLLDLVTPEDYGLSKANARGEVEPKWRTIDPTKLNYYDTVCATYMYDRGLLKQDEGALPGGKYQRSGMTRQGVDRIYANFDAYFADPEHTKLPQADLAPVKLAISRLPLLKRAEQTIFNLFNVEKRLEKKLGNCNTEEERLATKIDEMRQKATSFRGIIEDVNTGNTTGDLEIKATIEGEGTNYSVNIYAKPHAMTNRGFSERPQMALTFDSARPIFERQGLPLEKASDYARRFYEILNQLKPNSEKINRS
jgi:hypothetical protein